MATHKQMAASIGISAQRFSKKVKGGKFTQDEKNILTELYLGDPFLPECAVDKDHTILKLHQTCAEKDEAIRSKDDEIKAKDDYIAKLHRGFRSEVLVGVVSVIICFSILAPQAFDKWETVKLSKIYGYTMQDTRIRYLEMRVADMELLIEKYEAYIDKVDQLDKIKDQRFDEIQKKLGVVK